MRFAMWTPESPATSAANHQAVPHSPASLPSLRPYVAVQLLAGLAGVLYWLLHSRPLSSLGLVFGLLALLAPVLIGRLAAHASRWTVWAEFLRLATLALPACHLTRSLPRCGPITGPSLVLLAIAGSLVWLDRLRPAPPARPVFAPDPARRTLAHRCAALLLVIHVLYVHRKAGEGTLPELLYGCHVNNILLLVGLWTLNRRILSATLVFATGMGLPMWLILVLTERTTHALSVLLHTLPIAFALAALRPGGLSARSGPRATLGFFLLLPIAHHATPPALNVNLTHRPTPELFYLGQTLWGSRLLGCCMALSLLFAAAFVYRRLLGSAPERRAVTSS